MFLKKEPTEKGINYNISSTLFRVCLAILCSSIDRYQVDQQAPPWGLTLEMKRTSVAWAPDDACLNLEMTYI